MFLKSSVGGKKREKTLAAVFFLLRAVGIRDCHQLMSLGVVA